MSLNKKTNFAVIFPGQGSQYSGMGRFLYDNYQTARETFKLADDTLNFSLSDLCFNGNIKDITKTYNTQPALLTISYIMYQIYIKKRDLRPSLLLGHSLGELTALVCSNAIKFTDGIKIARDRGLYMQECGDKSEGSMLAVLSDDFKLIKKFCSEISSEKLILEIANYNSNNQIVLSGNIRALDMIKEKLKKENIHTCIDTSGMVTLTPDIKKLLSLTDLVLLDIKHINSDKCKNLVGLGNEKELAFARYLSDNNIHMWIRQVLVPGYTDDEQDSLQLKDFIDSLNTVDKIEVLPYHDMGRYKWEKLGLKYQLDGVRVANDDDVIRAKKLLGIT